MSTRCSVGQRQPQRRGVLDLDIAHAAPGHLHPDRLAASHRQGLHHGVGERVAQRAVQRQAGPAHGDRVQ